MTIHADRRPRRRFRLLTVSAVLAASALLPAEERAESPTPTLTDVSGIEDLRARFNRDAGHLRLVLLLSPT